MRYKVFCALYGFLGSAGGLFGECRSILWGVQELQEFRLILRGLNFGVQEVFGGVREFRQMKGDKCPMVLSELL